MFCGEREESMPKSSRGSTYNTAGKRRLLAFLSENANRQFTVEEIYDEMKGAGINVGKSSLYRILDSFCESGVIRKFKKNGLDSSLFQFIGDDTECGHHLHLKCEGCGKLVHLECHHSEMLVEHIVDEHGFTIDNKKSVLWGKCSRCKHVEEENKKQGQ